MFRSRLAELLLLGGAARAPSVTAEDRQEEVYDETSQADGSWKVLSIAPRYIAVAHVCGRSTGTRRHPRTTSAGGEYW